jgi:glycosyltransferase involved in cell wall biosynthesis
VVLYTFDFGSGWARNNPLAVVRAFRRAHDEEPNVDTQLVMKASGLTREHRVVLVNELATTDAVLIDDHLSDSDLGDLFHASDVYCSLHRAEGFGLGMAEAMAIGKAVIGTRYSGNLEFMNDANSLLVDYTKARITSADAVANPGVERIVTMGSPWAEPSFTAAVEALRQSFQPAVRERLGAAARNDMATKFSGPAASDIIQKRLVELRESLMGFRSNWPRFSS